MFIIPFSGDLLGDSRMSNVLDKSFIHRSYPKLAYGSIDVSVIVLQTYFHSILVKTVLVLFAM